MSQEKKGKIVLGVCSSISIYKACEIVRGFQRENFLVQVIMTKNATRFISPLLFGALTGQKVLVDFFEPGEQGEISHIVLAQEASLLVVAPATANIIGKFASGVADDFLSTFYMAARCPVLVAPAMNENMYFHRQTQDNILKLKAHGVRFIEPEKGYLACQKEGWGRLASVEKIAQEGLGLIRKSQSLKGKKIMITAGPTREFLDSVRFLSNPSSGKMGYELAAEACRRGAEVVLISGPTHLFPPPPVEFIPVQTAAEMAREVKKVYKKSDIVIMAAAVSDFKFASSFPRKIKKEKLPPEVEIVQTEDILKNIGRRKGRRIIVGFAAETDDVISKAMGKIKEKNLDLIIANNILGNDIGFGSDFNQVSLVYPGGQVVQTEKKSKLEISQIILDKIEEIIGERNS
ncbi:MAG: bifunctional phosphopantothenoylcysteine decarboxylase/phosphopantothenate--cysteine ligase CoaBC [Candidatus Aminicenantales bacterium]